MNCGVYEIVNKINGHKYVGSSIDIRRRWQEHKNDLRKEKHHNTYLQRAWNKYGEKCFKFKVLVYANQKESLRIENLLLDSNKYEYNIAQDAFAPMLGRKASKETRQKMSRAQKGREITKEHKENLSRALKGRVFPHQYHLSKNFSFSGKTHSKETKAVMSKKASGKNNSQWKDIDMKKVLRLKEEGYTQQKIAEIVGSSQSTIARRLTNK